MKYLLNLSINDSDNDGIFDDLDNCLTLPETFNNFQDEDGCPDFISQTDSDYDGIVDAFDDCKYSVETFNNFQDEDGCPDLLYTQTYASDSDGDGIIDNLDHCPNFLKIIIDF